MSTNGRLTDWEAGQDLIQISDLIGEKMLDLKNSHPNVWAMLDEVRRTIGDTFNRCPFKDTHRFGLISHNEEKR